MSELTDGELEILEELSERDEPWSDAIAAYLEAYKKVA